jgi:pimeloyl-ACP methyl ester carboxylesterase
MYRVIKRETFDFKQFKILKMKISNNYTNLLFTTIIAFTFYSCNLSKTFHKPSKIDLDIKKLSYFDIGIDTTYVRYNEELKQVNLFDVDKNSINNNYTIEHLFFNDYKLNGWMLKPKTGKPIATILHFHGSAGNILFHYKSAAKLAGKGFQVLTFDYSGYGNSKGKASRATALEDAYSALNYISKRNDVFDTKLFIYGESYGGYLAAIVGSNNQEKIDGIIIEGAFSSHKKEANHMVPILGNIVKNGLIAKDEIKKNKKPLLIIHSVDDKKVPIKFGKQIFENANSPKEFYEIDKPHINGLNYYSDEITGKIKGMILN